MKRILMATLLTFAASGTALAHDGEHDGQSHTHWWLGMGPDWSLSWYLGTGLGQSRFDDYEIFDDGSFTSQSKDDSGTTVRFFGGMGVGKYLGLELAYTDYGEASFRAQSDGSGSTWNVGPQRVTIDAKEYGLTLVGRLPLGDWALLAKVGQSRWDSSGEAFVDAQCCGAFGARFSDDGSETTYGGGVQYDGLRPLRIVGEYGVLPFEANFTGDEAKLDWLAISVAYLF